MLVADLPFWQKLWNKGVDIAAGVATSTISAAIIALIATWTWRWKRKRDLKHEADKQRQQYAIAEELAENRRARENRDRQLQLERELQSLAAKFTDAGTSGNAELLQGAWDTWLSWLHKNQLEYMPANRRIIDGWAIYAEKFRAATSQQVVSQ